MDGVLDSHFVNTIEMKLEKTRWKRVDSESIDKLVEKDETRESVLSKEEEEKIKKIFEETIGENSAIIQIESLAPDEQPVVITQSEFMRRMNDMSKLGGSNPMMMGGIPNQINAVVNANNPFIQKILKSRKAVKQKELARQAYQLGLLSQNMLKGSDLTGFIKRSIELMS